MTMKSIKTLGEEAEALVEAGVANREQLKGAVGGPLAGCTVGGIRHFFGA